MVAVARPEKPYLFPSEFATQAFRMPDTEGQLIPFSFDGRMYLVPVYDTEAQRILLLFSRQTEKSTSLGNRILTRMALQPFFRNLYVSPTQQQTEVFSKDRLSMPIRTSPVLPQLQRRAKGARDSMDNVLFKQFRNGASVTLRYAYLNADRTRGVPADGLVVDELQDVLPDVLPVVEETLKHSAHKLMTYAGTPKSTDNTIAYYWHRFSTQFEWAIPCDACGPKGRRHWIVVGYDNIGLKGLICERCGRMVDPRHPDAQWVSARSAEWLKNPPADVGIPFEGYRICQPLVPWLGWRDILDSKARYPIGQFMNEVLGLPYDSGDKPLKEQTLITLSDPGVSLEDALHRTWRTPLYMGVDWGGGGSEGTSYTVVAVGGYFGEVFQYVYFRRFTGQDAELENVTSHIDRLINHFRIHLVGVDYGGGLDKNDRLMRTHGAQKILRYQYVGTKRIYFDRSLARYMVNRNEALMAFINAVNRLDVFRFPRWESWKSPFAEDFLAVHTEYNESQRSMVVTKNPGKTDDALHAAVFCLLASMAHHPRPEILMADRPRND